MNRQSRLILSLAFLITLASIITWQLTGGDYYTKFVVIEEIEHPVDANDPLAAAGFYEDQSAKQIAVRNEFHLGLLPTATGLFEKHIIAVATIAAPVWIIALGLLWLQRRKSSRTAEECAACQLPGVKS